MCVLSLLFNISSEGSAAHSDRVMQGSVVFAHELAKRYGDRGLVSIAVNPGNIKSDLNKHAGKVQKLLSVSLNFLICASP